ncbi:insulinase family protein [bacterium]|nr:insulinase family protein [bacterium]
MMEPSGESHSPAKRRTANPNPDQPSRIAPGRLLSALLAGLLLLFIATGLAAAQAQPTQTAQAQPPQAPQAQAAAAAAAAAEFSSFTLENGFSVLCQTIPGSGAVSVGIVFRAGADAQTKKTAGLFRLLEHVVFRGEAAAPGEDEPAGALESLGATALGGGAGRDRFGFSFLVAPPMVGEGLDTIAYLFSRLRLETAFADPKAIEEARKASLADIGTAAASPSAVYDAAIAKKLFSTAPWRFDIPGAESVVAGATEESLKALAETWLVPNNAALILAGDFSPKEIRPLAEKAFAAWKKAADPWKTPPAAFPKPGVTRPTTMVYADESIPAGEALLEMRYRGPDSASPRSAAAELWAEMASRPDGRFALAIGKGMPKAAAPSDILARLEASPDAAWFSVSARLKLDTKANAADAAFSFKEVARGAEMYAMKTQAGYFAAGDYERAKAALLARRAAALAEPAAAGAALADGWILGGAEWLKNWPDRIGKVSPKDITAFADEYFMKNLEVVTVRLNPKDYAARKKTFDAYAFEAIVPQKAFWWQ